MNKIITGLLSLSLIAATVGGTAYALWSDTLPVNNVALTTGNGADLEFSLNGTDGWVDAHTFDVGDVLFENAYPGFEDFTTFFVRNNSESDIDLSLSGKIVSFAGDFNAVRDIFEMKISDGSGAGGTGYHTLRDWNENTQELGFVAPQGGTPVPLRLYLKVPLEAGNETVDIDVALNWEYYGTQVAPSATPTPTSTTEPTVSPTVEPTVSPTVSPTVEPTTEPTTSPEE